MSIVTGERNGVKITIEVDGRKISRGVTHHGQYQWSVDMGLLYDSLTTKLFAKVARKLMFMKGGE